ncbi:hypothetical protein [Terriglobus roseus]|uniref:Uncharacterized protein n=1 Tax=Terriglobus roseus TaxID=392734 RepID=A0A1H4U7C3_9BACT|nr:hypothetical protein [Terriglobus roseus]SEC64676.1 hypothetical protein SAMN05443244_3984 [Terriglobus roseus]
MAEFRLEQLAGIWVFAPATSRLNSEPLRGWLQRIEVHGDWIHVREEIQCEDNSILVEVNAQVDGTFYPLTGTVIADEKAYRRSGQVLEGIGHCDGAPAFRETLGINSEGELVMDLHFQVGNREKPVGTAHFRRQA